MTLSRLLLLPICLSALLLMGCPTDGRRDTFDYLRSPVTFSIDPVADNHPFCNIVGPDAVFPTVQECQAARKYRLRWERPEDTVGFSEYRIYVDTTNASGTPWSEVQKDPTLASFTLTGSPTRADSIIFVLSSNGSSGAALSRTNPRLVKLDTTGRIDALGKLVFAISTIYNQGGIAGQPRYTHVITNDRFSPYPILPVFTPKARSVEIAWSRPSDPTSFFDPKADSGIIKGYILRVVRGGAAKISIPFNPTITFYSVGGTNRTVEVQADSFRTVRGAPGYRFWLPDSHRVFNRFLDDARDSLKLTVSNLAPQDTVEIRLWPMDLEGNQPTDTGGATTLRLTDTTQPTKPVLQILEGSVTRNGFAYSFTASRDLVVIDGVLTPAASPNANIVEYRLSRRRLEGGSAGGTAGADSVFKLTAALRDREIFNDTVRYLPPGANFRIFVQAVDSTGHVSEVASIDVSTPAASFTGADSLATCPLGFIRIPGGNFALGSGLGGDEQPGTTRTIGSYCIEPYEHRIGDTTGPFQTKVTWEQARDICADISPANESHLCTEAEWERACEGTNPVPLVYGIQSEARDPGGVRYTCNVGTNDSVMANNINLRDPTCLSYDGVFDMAGNFAEWVLDGYTSGGYPSAPTDLVVGQPLTAPTSTSARVFRGSHYLNTNQTPAILMSAARCSNRDFATQTRPKAYAGCTDSLNPKLVVTYGTKPPRCFTLPDSLQGRPISSIVPGRDTNQILILLPTQNAPVVFTMPLDTAYRLMKPLNALLAPRAMAVVTFVNSETSEVIVDTLDATEMVSASEAGLNAIFTREASPPWSVRKVGGQYEIRYIYSYTMSQRILSRKYYSNKLIGFRCCSKPVPASLPKRRAATKR